MFEGSQYHGSWWPGDASSQGISSHRIGHVLLEHCRQTCGHVRSIFNASFSDDVVTNEQPCLYICFNISMLISDNEVTEVTGLDPVKLARLHTLELRGNKLTNSDGIYLPNLKNLFLVSSVQSFFSQITKTTHSSLAIIRHPVACP